MDEEVLKEMLLWAEGKGCLIALPQTLVLLELRVLPCQVHDYGKYYNRKYCRDKPSVTKTATPNPSSRPKKGSCLYKYWNDAKHDYWPFWRVRC